jgi:hypothetical protein
MAKSQIAVRIPPSLLEALNRYVEETGITKTEVIVSAIAAYLYCGSEIPYSCCRRKETQTQPLLANGAY